MLPNEQTLQFGQAKLKAKGSLQFTMRRSGDNVWYMVEEEASGKFYQIGLPQYTFLSLLDGTRTVNDALIKTASLLRRHALDEQESANLCMWMIESGLVETELSGSDRRRHESAQKQLVQSAMSWVNPISLKIPVFNPDAIATQTDRWLGWMVSPLGLAMWCLMVLYGGFELLTHWDQFVHHRVSSFSAHDILWCVVTWLLLKLTHESAHGLVCKRFGGRVTSFGILFLLMIPLPYVDVTTSWRFVNKWHRILTAAAGMLLEAFIAAIACVIWVESGPGPLQYHAGNVVIAATLHTLLFNANPLMKFDGYFILSDWLEIPNLADHGRQYVKSFFKSIYFGNPIQQPTEVGWRRATVKAYGFLSIGWFLSISLGLSLAASSLLSGVGLMIAMAGLLLWFGIPMIRLIKFVAVGSEIETPNRQRFAIASTITATGLALLLWLCPSPTVVTAPVVIDFDELSVVRSQSDGFIQQIHVVNGQSVRQGQLLVTLENRELATELRSTEIDIRTAQLRINAYTSQADVTSLQLEKESLVSFKKRRRELQTLVETLQIRAPQDGVVLGFDLAMKAGTFLRPGDEVLSVGKLGDLKGIALARQQDVEWIERHDQKLVQLRVWGHSESAAIGGTITHINPRARNDMPHDAFAASNGGPLSVVPRREIELTDRSQDSIDPDDLALTVPRVPIEIKLDPQNASTLWAGQTGQLYLRSRSDSLGSYLAANFVRFIRRNNQNTHGL